MSYERTVPLTREELAPAEQAIAPIAAHFIANPGGELPPELQARLREIFKTGPQFPRANGSSEPKADLH